MTAHIGITMSISAHPMNVAALLSTANASDGVNVKNDIQIYQPVMGCSVLELQIRALKKTGCTFFIIEVDQVSGTLLELVDGFRLQGITIEFVRSIKDLQALIDPEMLLYVQAEDHFLSEKMVNELTDNNSAFIATLDSRDENADFERIDLNTRWAGFASIEARRIFSISDLPADWSIISSLLRHALQEKVRFSQVQQLSAQKMDVVHITGPTKADALNSQILKNRSEDIIGWAERRAYAPIGRWLVPFIWKSESYRLGTKFSGMLLSIVCLALAILDWPVVALWTALLAVFFCHLNMMVTGDDRARKEQKMLDIMFWLSLSGAGFAISHHAKDFGSDPILLMAISIGLAILARKLDLPTWVETLLYSPTLFVLALILAETLSTFSIGLRVIAVLQLSLLIAGRYISESKAIKLN